MWAATDATLEDCSARILFEDAPFRPMLGEFRARVPDIKAVVFLGGGASADAKLFCEDRIDGRQPGADAMRSGEDLAGLFYMLGTTGCGTHREIANQPLRWPHSPRLSTSLRTFRP